jgi:hypothetical protein
MISWWQVQFSEKLGTIKGMVCDNHLTDNVLVCLCPYQCSPPKLQMLQEVGQDLLEKGVLRKSYSQYASPASLVPKIQGRHTMVIDYCLLNKKVVFDVFSMPANEHVSANFHNVRFLIFRVEFSVSSDSLVDKE